MAWFLSPKRNAERRLQTNIEYKKQKQQHNSVRYKEISHFKAEYEEYKNMLNKFIPKFFYVEDLNMPTKSNIYDIEREIEHLKKYEKRNLLKELQNFSDSIVDKYFICLDEKDQMELETRMMLLTSKNLEINRQIHEIKEKIRKVNIKIQELEDELEEIKENRNGRIENYDKMIEDNKYLQNLFINMININNFMKEYETLCKENNIDYMYTKKQIKNMYENYKLCEREMKKNYNNMLYAKSQIL